MNSFHFYASSIGEWRVSEDLEDLIKGMKRSRLDFTLWKIPGDKTDSRYEIEHYVPMVEDRVYLGMYKQTGKKWHLSCKEGN